MGTGYVVPVRIRNVLRPVEIQEAEAALAVYLAQPFRNFPLKACVLVYADKARPVIHIRLARVSSGLVGLRPGVEKPPLTAGKTVGSVAEDAAVAYQLIPDVEYSPPVFQAENLRRTLEVYFRVCRPYGP